MKSLKILWKTVADELATECHTSADLDYKKLEVRVEHEGLSFLTITLPAFGKSFERSLETGRVDSSSFVGFQRRKGPLPLFLGGFLSQVFDAASGLLLDEPNVDCIFAIRQLSLMFGKILVPCSSERERVAIERFAECDAEVERADADMPADVLLDFRRLSALLWSDVFSRMDLLVYNGELRPKHGPGATADRLRGNAKYDQVEWTERLERIFPFVENALPSWRYHYQQDHVSFLEPDAERPVKVISVPKTLKTPRIIAIEPTCMQYMQQALLNPLVELLESRTISPNTRENLAHGFVGFSDQEPNRRLARLGSEVGHLATLDLSEASDRVSNLHVVNLLSRWPHLLEAVQATRSTKADVPGVGVIPLSKFASMGSALCFPFEAMVFTTIIFLGIEKQLGRPLTRNDVKSYRGKVRVYGDDIIIPVDCVDSVIQHLTLFGIKVNSDKSFWNGKFRESCGGDYYDGTDVTPVRFRRMPPSSLKDAREVISLVEFRNHLYQRGLWTTCKKLDSQLEKILPLYPAVLPESPVLGRFSFLGYDTDRMDPLMHRPLVKGYVIKSKPPLSPVSGVGALLKVLGKIGDEPFVDPEHLERSGRPSSVALKKRWSVPF